MEQKLQQISNRLSNIEHTLCCICNTLSFLTNENSAELALLAKIIKDIEGTQNSLDTANTNINTANDGIDSANNGIATLSLNVDGVGQGVDDANEAIANIDCGSCDLTQVYNKLDKIIDAIPQMKCKYKKKDDCDENDKDKDKTNKTKKL